MHGIDRDIVGYGYAANNDTYILYLFICLSRVHCNRVHYIRVTLLRKKYFLFADPEYILHMISYILKLLTNS